MRQRILRADFAITIVFLIVAVTAVVQARRWPFRGGLFPLAVGSILLGLVLLKLVLDLVGPGRAGVSGAMEHVGPAPSGPPRSADAEEPAESDPIDVFVTASRRMWLSALGWTAVFFAMLWLLGALVAVPLFALLYLLRASGESRLLACSYALVTWLFVYGLFDRLLHIPLPPGMLLGSIGW